MLLDKVREMANAKQKEVYDHPEKYNEADRKYIDVFIKILSPMGIDLISEIPKSKFLLGLVFIGFDAYEVKALYDVLVDSLDMGFILDPDGSMRLKINRTGRCIFLLAKGMSYAEVARELQVSEKYVELCRQYEWPE